MCMFISPVGILRGNTTNKKVLPKELSVVFLILNYLKTHQLETPLFSNTLLVSTVHKLKVNSTDF